MRTPSGSLRPHHFITRTCYSPFSVLILAWPFRIKCGQNFWALAQIETVAPKRIYWAPCISPSRGYSKRFVQECPRWACKIVNVTKSPPSSKRLPHTQLGEMGTRKGHENHTQRPGISRKSTCELSHPLFSWNALLRAWSPDKLLSFKPASSDIFLEKEHWACHFQIKFKRLSKN